jgi:hypothetical protein
MTTPAVHHEWPPLPLGEWQDTKDTLHMWTQIVGKVRLALSPMINHWWQATLYVTPRGLTTSAIPSGERVLELTFDFVDHVLRAEVSDGAMREVALAPRSVADFYSELMATLRALGIEVKIWPHPVEVERAIPFDQDREHASYDAEHAARFWRVLLQASRVLQEFRGGFLGKCSPVHFFWGSFDLACTRFSGRRAPLHPGGVPNLADWVVREAYSRECISVGWWPGSGQVPEPAFYAYAYPEPVGCPEAPIRPEGARYEWSLREWVLPYEAVRTAADPEATLLPFCESTYDVAATLGGWDRAALERPDGWSYADVRELWATQRAG